MTITGQLDALALLDDDPLASPPKFQGFPRPTEPVIPDFPLTCPGCGQTETNVHIAKQNHWIHPADSHQFGHPVCISMNLTRVRVIYWLKCLSGEWTAPDKKCCHGVMKHHKGRVTRAYELEHLRADIAKAEEAWSDMTWLLTGLDHHDVTIDEAGLDDDGYGANCHRTGCHWVTREAGYATRAAAMAAINQHEKEDHND